MEAQLNQCRRWLQFKLSTWFVLVAIMAWVMASPPLVAVPYGYGYSMAISPALRWPILVLSVFLAWKLTWLVIEHRRARII